MPVYVDPVRGALMTLLPLALIVGIFLKRCRYRGWLGSSDIFFHAALYQAVLVFLYFAGFYSETGFFLFPADQVASIVASLMVSVGIIREQSLTGGWLVFAECLVGGVALVGLSFLWGWLHALLYPWLSRQLSKWVQPETKAGRIAFHCAAIHALLWVRYLLLYPLLLAPGLYYPLRIFSVSFDMGVFMINISTGFFLVGLCSALFARRHVGRLAALVLICIVCPCVLLPLASLLSHL